MVHARIEGKLTYRPWASLTSGTSFPKMMADRCGAIDPGHYHPALNDALGGLERRRQRLFSFLGCPCSPPSVAPIAAQPHSLALLRPSGRKQRSPVRESRTPKRVCPAARIKIGEHIGLRARHGTPFPQGHYQRVAAEAILCTRLHHDNITRASNHSGTSYH
jgi:hypothetical protein